MEWLLGDGLSITHSHFELVGKRLRVLQSGPALEWSESRNQKFQIFQAASACRCNISNPFLMAAPCFLAF